MNERLTEGKKTKQKTFSAGQSGAPVRWSSLEGFWISTSAEAESDWRIMLRDTLKTLKKRFWFGEGTRTQGKRGNKEQTVPFSEVVDGRFAGEFYTPEAPGRPFGCPRA